MIVTRKRNLAIAIVFSCLIIIGVLVFAWWANSPVKRSVTVSNDTSSNVTAPPPERIATAFFSTYIPAGFRVQTTENKNDPDMIQLSAFATEGSGVQVGITTAKLPAEGLAGVADYLYRVSSSDIYENTPSTTFPSSSQTFRKKQDGTEITSFLVNNDRYASVVVSSHNGDDATINRVADILGENWQWLVTQ